MKKEESHADRGHSQWSASSTARNWRCAGALAMATLGGPDKESEHAARGTAVHEIAERCLKNKSGINLNAIEFLGVEIKTKEHTIEIDEELADSAQVYINYVRSLKGERFIEKKFSLEKLEPPFEAGGTCDAIVVNKETRTIEVIDLKNGMGIVDVNENKQLRTYALGALLELPADVTEDIDFIKVTVVQPRAPHKDGRDRSETFHIADLLDWTNELMDRMLEAKQAFDEFQVLDGSKERFAEWCEKWLTPGACTFCKAESFCPKLKKQALEVAGATAQKWFEDVSATGVIELPDPSLLTQDELGHALDGLEMLEGWIKAMRARGHQEAERGSPPTGYMLVEKTGNRTWLDETKAIEKLKQMKLTDDQLYTKKLVSPAQADKLIGVKKKGELAAFYHSPVKGTNLVSSNKSTRPPAKSKVELYFETVKEN